MALCRANHDMDRMTLRRIKEAAPLGSRDAADNACLRTVHLGTDFIVVQDSEVEQKFVVADSTLSNRR